MLSPDTILQNRYRIVRHLGQGGMGTVYEAIDERLDNTVALKETLFTDERLRKQFEREARLLARLHHPALPKVFDHFSEDDGQFLVMQFVPGEDLWEMLRARKGAAFPPEEVLTWGDQLLDALDYLHSQEPSIIHRDIKPQNLKIARRKQIILLDFGLAKGFAGQMSRVTTSGSIFGFTPNFAPLEQIQGEGTDPRSDLYGLAATLYLLMTDFVPPDALKRITAIANGDDDPLRPANELNSKVSAEVGEWLQRAMAIARSKRPADANEMREELEAIKRSGAITSTLILPKKSEQPSRVQETKDVEREQRRDKLRGAPVSDKQPPAVPAEAPIPSTIVSPTERAVEQARPEKIHTPAVPPTIASSHSSTAKDNPFFRPRAVYEPSYLSKPQERPKSGSKRALIIVASLLVVGLVLFFLFRGSGEQARSTDTEQANQQANGNSNKQGTPVAPQGMAYVSGGEFTMGRDGDATGYESPAHKVTVKPFFMDIYEVTNAQYAKFVQATRHKPPSYWSNGTYPAGTELLPVTGVTWDDANAYANWAGKRLPIEEEWEFAARGTDGRRYPWGNDWKSELANVVTKTAANGEGNKGMAEVGSYSSYKGASPYGIYDMVGNAWEWTASNLRAYPSGKLPTEANANDKVIRGGSWASTPETATTTFRRGWGANTEKDYSYTGFRCVKEIGK
jgi:formylglycine-generating enzyme required for sulfatase activity